MPIPTEFFKFWIIDELTGKQRRTSFKMTIPEAAERYPDATLDPQTREVRYVPSPVETRKPPKA